MTSTSAPARVSRVSGRSAFGSDLEVAVGERLGGERVGGVLGVRGLHLARRARGGSSRPRSAPRRRGSRATFGCVGHIPTVRTGRSRASMPIQGVNRAIIAVWMTLTARFSRLLVEDGRRTYDDIAQRVSLSAPSVKRRVDRLRERGALEGFTAVVDHGAMGWNTEALVELFYRPGTTLDEVTKTLRSHPEVVEAWSVTGEADAIARVRTEDNAALERLIMDLQRRRAGGPHALAGGAVAAGGPGGRGRLVNTAVAVSPRPVDFDAAERWGSAQRCGHLWRGPQSNRIDAPGGVPKRSTGWRCKRHGYAFAGSNPASPTHAYLGHPAQLARADARAAVIARSSARLPRYGSASSLRRLRGSRSSCWISRPPPPRPPRSSPAGRSPGAPRRPAGAGAPAPRAPSASPPRGARRG